ncbi:GtrA family protein [Novosphingobium flavum]|uniref:GtrA family protein n=1 Tax=Novosphingobium flavum TaxID=1778672 RepID=A0A7X1FUH9_9SPHN|nr:GtrA family protein [Novosphingobium flavum]MBC2666562.1 GtrA family protein [Novosphingobium flavum]
MIALSRSFGSRRLDNALLLILPLAAMLPLLLSGVLALNDLGAHVGRFAVQLDGGASPELRQWYSFRWALIPNLGIDLLVAGLGPVVGLERAVWLSVMAIPALHTAGVLLLSRAVHGRIVPGAILAVPLGYSQVLHFGFVNYALSAALALLALALWITLGDRGMVRSRWLLFVPIGQVLWICHLSGWAAFCVMAAAEALVRERDSGSDPGRALVHAGIAVLPLAGGPLLGMLLGPHNVASAGELATLSSKALWLKLVLWDRWPWWDMASAALMTVFIVWSWVSPSFHRHRGLAFAGILLSAAYLMLPFGIRGSFYADMRLLPLTLSILLVAARPAERLAARTAAAIMLAALAFAGARIAGNAASHHLWAEKINRSLSLLDAVPRGSQMVNLYVMPCGAEDITNGERRAHIGGYALARRHAFDNGQFILPGGQLLSVHNPAAGEFARSDILGTSLGACPKMVRLADMAGRIPPAMTYLWVNGIAPDTRLPGWQAIAASGDSVMFRRVPQARE